MRGKTAEIKKNNKLIRKQNNDGGDRTRTEQGEDGAQRPKKNLEGWK